MPQDRLSRRTDLVAVSDKPIDAGALIDAVSTPQSGAVVSFLGTVRDHSPGREEVTHLEYEAYIEHVEAKIAEIVDEAHGNWSLHAVAAVHRTGSLNVGDISVGVAVSSAHRVDAFPAARYVIDELKSRAPIWKKEHWAGGADWVREDLHHSDSQPH